MHIAEKIGLRLGEEFFIHYDEKEKYFHMETEDDEFLCIPEDVLNNYGLDKDRLYLMFFDEQIVITSKDKIYKAMPTLIQQFCASSGIDEEVLLKSLEAGERVNEEETDL